MIRTIQQGKRIAEKNAAETHIRRNPVKRYMPQPATIQWVTHLQIAAENRAQIQVRPRIMASLHRLTEPTLKASE